MLVRYMTWRDLLSEGKAMQYDNDDWPKGPRSTNRSGNVLRFWVLQTITALVFAARRKRNDPPSNSA
ncbi:hypothetical protein SPFM5_00115 [Salmonella phage SPFM5]|nr:hypothetical protein SPFM5_00115 [Salmonella phage SPFM5]